MKDLFQTMSDTQIHLFVFGQGPARDLVPDSGRPSEHACGSARSVQRSDAREGAYIPTPSFYLVRPDGYIASCGTQLEVPALKRYLGEGLRLA